MIGTSIVRTFENPRTGQHVEVVEENEQITSGRPTGSAPSVPVQSRRPGHRQNPIYYAIARSNLGSVGEDPAIILYLTDAAIFDREGHQTDYTPRGAIKELKRIGYHGAELMEGILEITPISRGVPRTYDLANIGEWAQDILSQPQVPVDIEDLKRKLASSDVFQFSPSFQSFVTGGDAEIIPV